MLRILLFILALMFLFACSSPQSQVPLGSWEPRLEEKNQEGKEEECFRSATVVALWDCYRKK